VWIVDAMPDQAFERKLQKYFAWIGDVPPDIVFVKILP